MQSTHRKAALAFIFVTVILDVLALGIVIPVLPRLIEQFEGGNTARAAEVVGLFATVWAAMQFFSAPVLGALSDRFGRRPVILLSCLGLGLDYLLMAVAPTLAWLFVGRVLSGVFAAGYATASAYIADVTPPDKRAAAFGIVGAAWGFGFVAGPAMGGILGDVDPRLPFWIAAALTLANAAYGLIVLPESLPRERRVAFAWKRANPLGALKLLRAHRELLGLASVSFLYWLAHQVLSGVFVLYVGYRYGWSTQTIGLTLAGVGICNVIVQGRIGADSRAADRRASCADHRRPGQRARILHLRCGAERCAVLARHSHIRVQRPVQPLAAGVDDTSGFAVGTGTAAGRERIDHGHRRVDRPSAVRADVFVLHHAAPRAFSSPARRSWLRADLCWSLRGSHGTSRSTHRPSCKGVAPAKAP
jgi:multidrug resistance protein